MRTITLSPNSSIADLGACALEFAADRVALAKRTAAKAVEQPSHARLRRKFAARQCRQAIDQLNAAIALLEMED